MNQYWSQGLGKLTPYVPGEYPSSAGIIKLNTNENPFGPSKLALDAIKKLLGTNLRLYPDSGNSTLRKIISDYHGISEKNVFVGNGSDEVLAHIFRGLFKQGKPLIFPDITYSFYPSFCNLFGITFEAIPLTKNYEIDLQDYGIPNGGVIFPNPNAPTGIFVNIDKVVRFLDSNTQSVVVIDEAYVDFGGTSVISLIKSYKNLIVTRTLSKSHSLAGLRVGYAVGNSNLIEALDIVKNSFNSYPVDLLAEAGAVAAISDRSHLKNNCAKIIENRSYLTKELRQMGFHILPSMANFLCACLDGVEGKWIADQLKIRGILIRHFQKPDRLGKFVRITVGTKKDCESLIVNLNELFGE